MKQTLKLAVILVLVVVILTGCARIDYQVTVNRNGSGRIEYTYGFNRDLPAQMQIEAVYMTQDMRRRAEEAGFETEPYSDDQIEGFRATKRIQDVTEGISLAEIFGEENIRDVHGNNILIQRGTFIVRFSQNGIIDLTATAMEAMGTYGIEMDYSINLPVRVVRSNADNVSLNGRTLTWELQMGEENRIEFMAQGLTLVSYALIGLGILLIIGIILLIIRGRGKKKERYLQELDEH